MKANTLTIGFREWSKLADFVETINQEDEMVAYQIDMTTALLVAVGECGLAWIDWKIQSGLTPCASLD